MGAEAIRRWKEWDAEWSGPLNQRHFFTTGDLILRPEADTLITETRKVWDRIGTPYEMLTPDEMETEGDEAEGTHGVRFAVEGEVPADPLGSLRHTPSEEDREDRLQLQRC